MSTVIDSFSGQYRFLSNFYSCWIAYEEALYPSLEHAFQAAKTTSPDEQEWVRSASRPGEAKRRGRKVTKRDDWDDVRITVMRDLLIRKFSEPRLQQQLLSTGNMELIEGNDWGDVFWGVCRGHGENWLGKLLMEVRDHMKTKHPGYVEGEGR